MKARYGVTDLRSKDGFAMAATLGVLSILSILVVTVFANAISSFRSGMTDLEKSRAYYAAEAGAESGMAQLALALEDAVIEDRELTAITAPEIPGFTFENFAVTRDGGVETEQITDGPYTGLYSRTQLVEIHSEAVAPDYTTSAILVTAKAQAIPIFQFGVFFEKDLEISNLPPMTFGGWIHSNGSIWTCSNNAYYEDLITTPNKYYRDWKFQHCTYSGVWIDDATATGVRVLFDSRSHPDPNDFRARSDADFDNRLKTDAYGVDSLSVPLPDGIAPVEVVQPRDVSDGLLERTAKFAWKADWHIELDLSQIADGSEATDLCNGGITHTRDGGQGSPTAAECQNIFSFDYDMWYEARELRYADVLDIDVAELFDWATGGNATGITYITMTTAGADDPQGDGVFPVVRLVNGSVLDAPITFSTNHPMYVLRDFNTGVWQPTTLVGDAMTILSNNWDDAQHQTTTVNRNNWPATNTEVNAAILAGHSATACDHEVCGNQAYGGGLENFPRFLENWNGDTLTYSGSLVSLFFNQQGNGPWKFSSWGSNGQYYYPPTRNWQFDTRFENPDNLPPGTPVVGNVIHTAFRPLY